MKERFNDFKKQRLDVVMGFPRRFFSQFLPQRRYWFLFRAVQAERNIFKLIFISPVWCFSYFYVQDLHVGSENSVFEHFKTRLSRSLKSFGLSPGLFIDHLVICHKSNNCSSRAWIRHWEKSTDESGKYLTEISWVKWMLSDSP